MYTTYESSLLAEILSHCINIVKLLALKTLVSFRKWISTNCNLIFLYISNCNDLNDLQDFFILYF